MTTHIHNNLNIQRLPKVLARTGDARSTHYVRISDGTFTPPVSLGGRAVGWPEYEVDAIISARIAGKSADEIRTLVNKLVAARASMGCELVHQLESVVE